MDTTLNIGGPAGTYTTVLTEEQASTLNDQTGANEFASGDKTQYSVGNDPYTSTSGTALIANGTSTAGWSTTAYPYNSCTTWGGYRNEQPTAIIELKGPRDWAAFHSKLAKLLPTILEEGWEITDIDTELS